MKLQSHRTLLALAALAGACAVLPAQAGLVHIGTNLNGNQAVPVPPLDLSAGLEGYQVFTSMNPIQLIFAVEAGTPAQLGFQFNLENESAMKWGDFHVTLSGGAYFAKAGDVRAFNGAPADVEVAPGAKPTQVDMYFDPKLPCFNQFVAGCAAPDDLDNAFVLGDFGFAGDSGVGDAPDWIINVGDVVGGAAGRIFTLTFTPSLDGRPDQPIPVPGSLPLVLAGLAAWGWRARQRSNPGRP